MKKYAFKIKTVKTANQTFDLLIFQPANIIANVDKITATLTGYLCQVTDFDKSANVMALKNMVKITKVIDLDPGDNTAYLAMLNLFLIETNIELLNVQ